jgi:hypothetical protein
MPESPLIDFRIHESRNGLAGARAEFEEMVNQLVHVIHPDSRAVQADPGDWGLDAFAGDLNGTITVWQSKYFEKIGASQFGQITESLNSVVKQSALHGFVFNRWILCTPCELGPSWAQRWQSLEQRFRNEYHVELEFWGRTALTERLRRPEAWHLRYSYYGGEPPPRSASSRPPYATQKPPRGLSDPWKIGDLLQVRDRLYVLRQVFQAGGVGSAWRSCVAVPNGRPSLVWIQQARGQGAESLRRSTAALALPPVEVFVDEVESATLITSHPDGQAWTDLYPAGPLPPAALSAFLGMAAAAGRSLLQLHAEGFNHRRLDGGVFIVQDRKVKLRDGGLMGTPGLPEDRLYAHAAPEQQHPPYSAGQQTDLYQFAALIRRSLTGRTPRPGSRQPSLRLLFPALQLDEPLNRALGLDPEARGGLDQLIDALDVCAVP